MLKNVMVLFAATETIPAEYAVPRLGMHLLVAPIRSPWMKKGYTRLPASVATHKTANTANTFLCELKTALAQKKKGTV